MPRNPHPPPSSEPPRLAIALVTYKRLEQALRTIESTCANLKYPTEKIKWIIGDDGSDGEYVEKLVEVIQKKNMIYKYASERMRNEGEEDTYYCGRMWNWALGNAHQYSDYVLWLEDDWILDEPLDLTRYVKLLDQNPNVGAISFRILSIETDVRTKGYDGKMYVEYLRSSQYAYSGNPILRHARFVEYYGWFHEQRDPGNIELDMDDKYRADAKGAGIGPTIWRPLDISPWGAWKHIGKEKTWK